MATPKKKIEEKEAAFISEDVLSRIKKLKDIGSFRKRLRDFMERAEFSFPDNIPLEDVEAAVKARLKVAVFYALTYNELIDAAQISFEDCLKPFPH